MFYPLCFTILLMTFVNKLFTAALLLFVASTTYAQSVPNGGFEIFSNGQPDSWITPNIPELGVLPVVQSSDAYEGSYAVRGDVIKTFSSDTIPASLISGESSALSGFKPGFPYTKSQAKLRFYYKFVSISGDVLLASALTQNKGVPVGGGSTQLGPASAYTVVDVPIVNKTGQAPDTALILFSIWSLDGQSAPHPGSYFIIDAVNLVETSSVEGTPALKTSLMQNYPNPFNPSTTIPFMLAESGNVTLTLYDANDIAVRTMLDHSMRAGAHAIKADLNGLPTGVYTYELTTPTLRLRKRMILTK